MSFTGGSEGKASACNIGDPGLIPGSGRSPGEGNRSPFWYACLENPSLKAHLSLKKETTEFDDTAIGKLNIDGNIVRHKKWN